MTNYGWRMFISPLMSRVISRNHENARRRRKLLVHAKEIKKLKTKTQSKGVTLVPVRAYFKGNKVKIVVGLAKGKKAYDKRETIKERDVKREMSKRGSSRADS